jgi:hypothetical protein
MRQEHQYAGQDMFAELFGAVCGPDERTMTGLSELSKASSLPSWCQGLRKEGAPVSRMRGVYSSCGIGSTTLAPLLACDSWPEGMGGASSTNGF